MKFLLYFVFIITFCLPIYSLPTYAQKIDENIHTQDTTQKENKEITLLQEEAKQHLINLIGIDTAQPNAEEIKAVRYIYTILNKNKIDWEIFRQEKNHANLVVLLKAPIEENKKQPTMLLISHLDTATIQENWSMPPIKATIKDNKIYGLGASDAKNYVAINLTLLTYFQKHKELLNRDLLFLFTADEEAGSNKGLKYLYEKIPHILSKVKFALNEGGGTIQEDENNIFFIEGESKMYFDILLTAKGVQGGSTTGTQNNAIYKLSNALERIKNYELPYTLTPFTRKLFEDISKLQDEDARTTISMLLNPTEEQYFKQAAEIISEDPFFETQLKDTITPTIITSFEENNTITPQATALLNCRLLPSTNPQQFFDNLSKLFEDDEDIILNIKEQPELPFPTAPNNNNNELFDALNKSAQQTYGNITLLVGISPASSESEILRRHNILTYGIGPKIYFEQKGQDTQKGAPHQADEFIEETSFNKQLLFTFYTILNLLNK